MDNQTSEQTGGPGFSCPNCSFTIEVTLQKLLYEPSLKCPSCLTDFKMDRTESNKALDLMQKLNTAIENVEMAKNFKG